MITDRVICVRNAERAVPAQFPEAAARRAQYLAPCSGEEETEVLHLLTLFSAFVYCLTPCQNSVHLAKLRENKKADRK